MKDRIFLDTNLWVYLYSRNSNNRPIREIIDNQFENIVISVQVLGELFNVLTKKDLKDDNESSKIVSELIKNFMITSVSTTSVRKAIEIEIKYNYSYWDSLIISSALENNCDTLYTEDLQHNQIIEDELKIVNPFLDG